MLYKYIIEGCECWLTKKTADAILAEIARREAEREEEDFLRKLHERCLRYNDPADWDFYSDLFKDCYGFRPHF